MNLVPVTLSWPEVEVQVLFWIDAEYLLSVGHPSTNAQHAIGCAYGAFKATVGAGDSDSIGANYWSLKPRE